MVPCTYLQSSVRKTCFRSAKTPFYALRKRVLPEGSTPWTPARGRAVQKEKTPMARPRKPDNDRRKHPRSTRYSDRELALLEERAAAAGMDTAEFLREISLRRHFTSRPPLADAEFLLFVRGEIGRIGNNLNQFVQRLNAADLAPQVARATAVLDELEAINIEVLKLLRDGYSGKKQG